MNKYISKKTQKITSALYLVTDFIKDSDAMKWEIREESIALVSSALMLNTTSPTEKDHAIRIFTYSSEKLISFLNITITSSLISNMNASIIIRELESLVDFVTKESKESHLPGYILSDSFFATDTGDINIPDVNKGDNFNKGQKYSSRTSVKSSEVKSDTSANNIDNLPSPKKNTRKDIIVDLLKKDSNLTIKDFSKVIKDCSEKTIQRELIFLVRTGVIKKEGERRWSTYSLM